MIKVGDRLYIVENNGGIREVEVKSTRGERYLVNICGTETYIKINRTRLLKREEAEKKIAPEKPSQRTLNYYGQLMQM